jgi:uncharacterized protein affecting Mg2+/Co2+ transport
MPSSAATTLGVKVEVVSEYDPERSRPIQHQWFFRYTITITNQKTETVQLLSRHWIITDARGHVDEVRGLGVVGQQPEIEPGESYSHLRRVAHDSVGQDGRDVRWRAIRAAVRREIAIRVRRDHRSLTCRRQRPA